MKLGLVVPGGFDPSGREGIIPALLSLTSELGRRHDVRVFAAAGRNGRGRYLVAGADVTQHGVVQPAAAPPGPPGLLRAPLQRIESALRLARALDRWMASVVQPAGPPDVLHAFWADRTALLAILLARRRSIPSIVSLGGGEAVWFPAIGYGGAGSVTGRATTRAALRLANAVTAGSAFALGPLPARLRSRAQIVPLGVQTERFAASPERPPGPPWRLIHVASLNPVKDQTTLLEAFRRVVDRLGDVRLDCVGEDTLAGAIQARARDMGLGDRVSFCGFLPQQALASFYRMAHLNVIASRHESQGVVILEAAAAGLPTVGTRVGLLATLAPEAARAVAPGDPGSLGDAVCELLPDRAARETMGAAAQAFALCHDAAWTARTFEGIYERAARANRGTGFGGRRT